jgi:dimethylargininase
MSRASRLLALTREVSPALARGELTYLARQPIDLARARAQHHRYEACLSQLGCAVLRLPAEPDLPDSVFVEDAALVLDEVAVLTRPGAASRRDEVPSVGAALAPYRALEAIEAPATLDGGDVLVLGRTVHVGLSSRSDAAALSQLGALLTPRGYEVRGIRVEGCLHLKSAVTPVGPDTVLLHPGWVRKEEFAGWQVLEVDPAEPFGANALLVGETVLYPAEHPRTADRLRAAGVAVLPVEASELAKAEGAVTCCSLLVRLTR